ncbi:hypothetical protein [Nonomuraea endophytica]|uniref:hypothetical protein n=1 Tax=Nonomuraea endophytica TaxID=714136 RepID=UPI0037C7AB45
MSAATEAKVLELLLQGRPVPAISDVTTWPIGAVRKLADRNGMLISQDGVAYQPDAGDEQQFLQAVEGADPATLAKLAQSCPDRLVQEALKRHQAAAKLLRERLLSHAQQALQRRRAELVREQSQAEIKRLTAELELAKARLNNAAAVLGHRAKKKAAQAPRRYRPGRDYTTSEVRAWAKANGYDELLPRAGSYVPDELIDAMRAAERAIKGDVTPAAVVREVA